MTERDDCIGRIVKASGGKLSRKEAMDSLDEILARAESNGPSWQAADEKLAKTAAAMEDNLAERASIARRNEHMSAMKAIERSKYYARAPSPAQGLEAKLGGINVPFAGGRLSVDAQYKGLRRALVGGFWDEMEKHPGGLDKLFMSQSIEREWMTELHELNKVSGGHPGITNSKNALAIAEIIQRWQGRAIERINQEGGWVKSYSGYITKTSHDSDRIRRAGREKWIDDVMKHIDIVKTFHDADPNQARFKLQQLWPQFVTGDHLDYSKILEDSASLLLDMDFAKKASAPRELHWKDADAWAAYNKDYGRFSPTFAVTYALDTAARVTALMKEFGPTPRKALDDDLHNLYGKMQLKDPQGHRELKAREQRIRNIFAQFDGTAAMPVNAEFARIMSDVRAVVRMSKLGLTPFAMLSDLATKASELRYQGMSVPERFGGTISDYFRGPMDGRKREVARLLGHAFESEIGDIARRLDPGDMAHNAISRAEQRFFRWTGMNAMTYNQRHGAERIMAAHFGSLRDQPFTALSAEERRIMSLFDIGQPEWDVLHKVEWNKVGGDTFFTPEIATRLSDADVRSYLVASGKLHQAATGDGANFTIKKARDDLGMKIAAYFADRGDYAVLEPGARERAILYGGHSRDWAPGTVKGEAWRLFMQFKAFPAVMMYKTWGREIYGGQGKAGAAAGLAEFIVYATALGVVANALNQLAKGQDPFAQWRNQPGTAFLSGFIRGGAGSIYGDFLLGEWSRFGLPASATILGPTLGQIDRVAEIWSDIGHSKEGHWKAGRATAQTALKMVRENTPFANMIYTKYAVDALIYWRLAEWISPGFLERHERNMKDKQGIQYIEQLRPTRVSR